MTATIEVTFVDGWHVARVVCPDGRVLNAGRHLNESAAYGAAKRFRDTYEGGVVAKNPNARRSPHPRAQRKPA